MKAIIVDDEPLARSVVKEYLEDHPFIEVVQECSDGFEGVKAVMQHNPDLMFLDIQMPKINGFEMLELIEQPPAVIFTTAFDEYAIKAFDTHAIDYLLKPFSKQRFDKAITRLMDRGDRDKQKNAAQELLQDLSESNTNPGRIVVKTGGKIIIIPMSEVLFLEAADDYVKIHTANGTHMKYKTMSYYEKTLPPSDFIRTHRSFIVNVKEITRIDPYEKDSNLALLRNGMRVPVSKSGYAKLKEVLGM
jgi:two-component system LytT family response regulator